MIILMVVPSPLTGTQWLSEDTVTAVAKSSSKLHVTAEMKIKADH